MYQPSQDMTRIFLFFAAWLIFTSRTNAQGISWNGPCTDKLFCLNAGSCSQGNVFLVEKATTGCGNQFINYSFRIDLDNNGSTDIMSTEDTINAPFTLGTHRVIWRASDNCGNMATCEYLFTIRDCNPPNLLCINGLTQNLDAPFCTANFSLNQFILNLNDNCTPTNQIQLGMRLAGDTSSAFPTAQSISFDSCDVGVRFIEIRVRDGGGLQNSCASYVIIQDANKECSCNIDADIDFQGCVRSAGNQKLSNYFVRATLTENGGQNPPPNWTQQQSMTDSCFSLKIGNIPFGSDYTATVRAFRNDGPLVGFTTFDLLQISKHILGIESFTNFYQMLAADINNSRTVTTFDIVEGRKVLLGITDTFLAVPSWRLIRPLNEPTQLLQWDLVRDTYQINYPNLTGDPVTPGLHFIGVKSGDANMSAAFGPNAEDRSGDPVVLILPEGKAEAGARVTVPVQLLREDRLAGWQMALFIDPAIWSFEGVAGLPEDQYFWDDGRHILRVLWYDPESSVFSAGEALFSLHLRARGTRQYDGISLHADAGLRPEAYSSGGQIHDLVLERKPGTPTDTAVNQIFSPRPNPFSEQTEFPVRLSETNLVELEIWDATGRLLYRQETLLESGYHALRLEAAQLQEFTGVLTYRIRVGNEVRSGVVVVR
jgi:hypothetical protein